MRGVFGEKVLDLEFLSDVSTLGLAVPASTGYSFRLGGFR
jgi:hypothetical protein